MTPQPFDLDAACAAALKRLQESLNRSAGQHQMHLRRAHDARAQSLNPGASTGVRTDRPGSSDTRGRVVRGERTGAAGQPAGEGSAGGAPC